VIVCTAHAAMLYWFSLLQFNAELSEGRKEKNRWVDRSDRWEEQERLRQTGKPNIHYYYYYYYYYTHTI
jgi:hypothetical protein